MDDHIIISPIAKPSFLYCDYLFVVSTHSIIKTLWVNQTLIIIIYLHESSNQEYNRFCF
ncbi:hypothetical protein HanXRQr2_Chr15g0693041 [Helianthus annuus]|uniref:Uncharacterized protein n=1 Tax=Helianthus annuus TaxID=4232 RepID=A0A9K3DZW2_HELAN|nr:hypothetical protein HanXRQr2_Chr15g0693041 [Helianthus annuus]KAJ0831253.1 hypothetical protein HanPSC8_Chr15g0664951 [Helianthus annuus]